MDGSKCSTVVPVSLRRRNATKVQPVTGAEPGYLCPCACAAGMSAAEAVKQCLAGKPNAVKGKITGMVPGLAVQVRDKAAFKA